MELGCYLQTPPRMPSWLEALKDTVHTVPVGSWKVAEYHGWALLGRIVYSSEFVLQQ